MNGELGSMSWLSPRDFHAVEMLDTNCSRAMEWLLLSMLLFE